MENPNHKGNVAELAIAAEAANLGLSVLKPLTEHERYDLVMEVGGRLLRVQCKWATLRGEVVMVRLTGSYHSPTRGYVKSTYGADEVDAIAAYCHALRKCYLLPIEPFAGKSVVHLRNGPARNNQRASVHWATAYEFPGAVAQLAERCRGTAEVTGSNPVSSTTDDVATTGVGMDRFYAGLAHYVRRAEAGGEVVVTRWGRPVARLVPADLNPAAAPADA
jgi:prevent-host-death family protein